MLQFFERKCDMFQEKNRPKIIRYFGKLYSMSHLRSKLLSWLSSVTIMYDSQLFFQTHTLYGCFESQYFYRNLAFDYFQISSTISYSYSDF